MSCIIGALSALGIVNVDILKMALEVIAKEEGIEVGKSVKKYSGSSCTSWEGMEIIGSLTINALPRGIGVAVDKQGKLHFIGDSYNCETAYNKLKERIETRYKDVSMILTLQELGYEVETTEKDGTAIFVGVKQ